MPILRQVIDGDDIRPMYNATGSDIPAGRFVKFSAVGDPPRCALPAAVDDAITGVTVNAIANGRIGDVQIRGKAIVQAGSGGVTGGDRIMPEAATGKGITFSASADDNASICGQTAQTVAADAYFELDLIGPAVSRQG